MKQLTAILCLALLFVSIRLSAQQKQGAWWYFGDKAGLNFNTEPPSPDSAGQALGGYGCASVSDENGNLLFYADGNNVFNKFHQSMPNGTNLRPLGSNGQTNVIVVQKPGSSYLYYLFSASRFPNALTPNFTYSIIDMRLDSGKGDIVPTTKNTFIFSGSIIPKFTAAMHANNKDVWVIAHSRTGTNFFSFLITSTGIAAPVTSPLGISYVSGNDVGMLKSSPSSELIADAVSTAKVTQLLDLNRSTGALSNARLFSFAGNLRYAYGLAFSPDGSKLYLGDLQNVYQYNLLASSFQNVLTTQVTLNLNSNIWYYDLQLGMNGKIYLLPESNPIAPTSRTSELISVIHCPNKLGFACNLQDTAIYIGRQVGANLPALNQTLFRNANILQLTSAKPYICPGDSVKLSAFGAGADHFTWLSANGLSQASGPEVFVKPTATTTYTVIGYSQCDSDTVSVTVPVVPPAFANAGANKVICTTGSVQIGVPAQPGFKYAWNASPFLSDTTLANPVFTATNTTSSDQVYQLILSMDGPGVSCGKQIDTVQVLVKAPVQVNAGAAFSACSGTSVQLNPQQFNNTYSYSWSPATGLSNPNSFAPTLSLTNISAHPDTVFYTLTASAKGCSASSQVQIVIMPEPTPIITGPTSVCPGSVLLKYAIQNHQAGNLYTWGVSGGAISQTFNDSVWVNWGVTSATAKIWVIGSNNFSCLSDTVFFPIRINPLLLTEKPKGNGRLCENDRLNQQYQIAHTQGSLYTWGISGGSIINGQGSHQIRVNWQNPGQHKLSVQETAQTSLAQCFGVSDTLSITVLPSPDSTLTIQGANSVCHQSVQQYNFSGLAGSTYQWQVTGGNLTNGQGSNTVTINWQTVGQGEIKVREIFANGCPGKLLALKVQVNPLPQPVVNSNNYFCPEEPEQTYQVQGLPGSSFQWQVNGGTIISNPTISQVLILWDSLSTSHTYSVTETTAYGCISSATPVTVNFDRSELELLSVGLDEAETGLVIQYNVKKAQHYPQPELNIQEENAQSKQWQLLSKTPITSPSFTAPLIAFEASFYRLQGQNQCFNELLSAIHRPVKLSASGDETSGQVNLSWTSYRGWKDIIRYEIWRQLEGQTLFEKLNETSDTGIILQTGRDGFRQRYRLKAVSATGTESWSQSVGVTFLNELIFPNIITANNDNLNDTFTAEALHLYPNSSLRIYNRWGKEVFSSDNYKGDWEAKGVSSGIYYYHFQTQNGKSFKGWVEVVR